MIVKADKPGHSAPTATQALAEAARADSLEVEPRNQLFDALGLSQVRRQEPRAEFFSLRRARRSCTRGCSISTWPTPVVIERWGSRPLRTTCRRPEASTRCRVRSNPLGNFRFDCRGRRPLGRPREESPSRTSREELTGNSIVLLVASDMVAYCGGDGGRRITKIKPKYAAFFNSSRPRLSVISPRHLQFATAHRC